jgi:class 3 adenylate cyclase
MLRPLDSIAHQMNRVAQLQIHKDEGASMSRFSEIRALQHAYDDMQKAVDSFTRYVPRDVVKDLMQTGQLCAIGMSNADCVMLFSDIVSFTSICERVPADRLGPLITAFFEASSHLVMEHGGLVDKFIGDCVMAVWGAPFACPNMQAKAALCALRMSRETMVAPLQTLFEEEGEVLALRVGVNGGTVLAGNMGSAQRMSYTVIGDAVNLAARLEGLNKKFGTRVLLSEFVVDHRQHGQHHLLLTNEESAAARGDDVFAVAFALRLLGRIQVVGKEEPVRVYEAVGLTGVHCAGDNEKTAATGDGMTSRQASDDYSVAGDSHGAIKGSRDRSMSIGMGEVSASADPQMVGGVTITGHDSNSFNKTPTGAGGGSLQPASRKNRRVAAAALHRKDGSTSRTLAALLKLAISIGGAKGPVNKLELAPAAWSTPAVVTPTNTTPLVCSPDELQLALAYSHAAGLFCDGHLREALAALVELARVSPSDFFPDVVFTPPTAAAGAESDLLVASLTHHPAVGVPNAVGGDFRTGSNNWMTVETTHNFGTPGTTTTGSFSANSVVGQATPSSAQPRSVAVAGFSVDQGRLGILASSVPKSAAVLVAEIHRQLELGAALPVEQIGVLRATEK